nr:hypothetical protein [Oceanococcus sp. HetDA_MAG_MS8]
MSKFRNVQVDGDGVQVGDNNVQNNVTNHTYHHRTGGNNSDDGGEAIAIIVGAAGVLAALIWATLRYNEQVYFYLKIGSLASVLIALLSLVVLLIQHQLQESDALRAGGILVIGVVLFGLIGMATKYAPLDAIQFSKSVGFQEFWRGLTDYGRNVVLNYFVATFAIGAALIFTSIASLRQLFYATASSEGVGFSYSLYRATAFFGMKVTSFVVTSFSALAWASLNGKLPAVFA